MKPGIEMRKPSECGVQRPGSNYKLIICDLDGTLLDSNNRISTDNFEAIAKARELGLRLTLATGRMDGMIRVYVSQLKIDLPAISCNGAVIRDCATNKIMRSFPLYKQDYTLLTNRMLEHKTDFLCYTADAVYYPAYSKTISRFHSYNQMAVEENTQTIPLFSFEKYKDEIAPEVVKLMAVLESGPEYDQERLFLKENTNCTLVQSMNGMVDIMRKGISKGSAMRFLASRLNIGLDSIVAFGDQENDIDMIESAGLGIAMGNAIEEVKSAGKIITANNDDSGVARAIYDYLL